MQGQAETAFMAGILENSKVHSRVLFLHSRYDVVEGSSVVGLCSIAKSVHDRRVDSVQTGCSLPPHRTLGKSPLEVVEWRLQPWWRRFLNYFYEGFLQRVCLQQSSSEQQNERSSVNQWQERALFAGLLLGYVGSV
jgi:hypothetical protein